jgi:hypothetical protein
LSFQEVPLKELMLHLETLCQQSSRLPTLSHLLSMLARVTLSSRLQNYCPEKTETTQSTIFQRISKQVMESLLKLTLSGRPTLTAKFLPSRLLSGGIQ